MQLPPLTLGWLLLFYAARAQKGDGGVPSPPPRPLGELQKHRGNAGETATPQTLASSASSNGRDISGFRTREGGGSEEKRRRRQRQQQQQRQRKQQQQHQQQQQGQQAPRTKVSTTSTVTATQAAAAAVAAAGVPSKMPKKVDQFFDRHDRILAASVEVTEEEEDDDDYGGGACGDGNGEDGGSSCPLVPSFCPSEAFERYAALHRDIVEGKLEPRYLVFRPYLTCGMGNRLNGFRGVMALAMVTGRALLVDWCGGRGTTCSRTSHKYEDNFLEAQGVPWNHFPPSMEDYENLDGVAESTEVWCQMPNAVDINTPCDETRMTPQFLVTANWTQIYAEDAQVVIVQAHNQNPMQHLRLNENPSVLEVLSGLDSEVSPGIFDTCALRFLFKARPEFKDRYCEDRSAALGGKIASIALHIRTGDNPNYHPEWYETLPQDVDNFVMCATGFDEGLAIVAANYSSSTAPDDDVFRVFEEGADSVWLLGTDSSKAIDLLAKRNQTVEGGGKVVFIEGDEFHRVHSGGKGGAASNNAGPVVDLALLSEAPLLVGSIGSTFSNNAAVVGGLPVPLRLFLSTPFRNIVSVDKKMPWDLFEDYRQGCRDLVSDLSNREDLRLALMVRSEPWIEC
ncbi:unnamed protein product [Pylaiella littoralis]